MILTAFGVHLDPDQLEAIVVAGLAVTGLLNVFFKDESNPAAILKDKKDIELNSSSSLSDIVAAGRDNAHDSDSDGGDD